MNGRKERKGASSERQSNAAGDFPAVAGKVNRLVRNSESEKGERQ